MMGALGEKKTIIIIIIILNAKGMRGALILKKDHSEKSI